MAKDDYAIGLDLGGTKILVGFIDHTGRIIAQKQLSTLAEEGEKAVVERVLSAPRLGGTTCDVFGTRRKTVMDQTAFGEPRTAVFSLGQK
ncbi:hypothetical protein [Brevibacillus antibioticus]|uniref:hypothetical protein n=1 Tax=Brevibacillus antibioticus TaxID=2570228 RepID=UPI001FCB070C|nr:hypothetical protein [Brevibacillus antibioticus]